MNGNHLYAVPASGGVPIARPGVLGNAASLDLPLGSGPIVFEEPGASRYPELCKAPLGPPDTLAVDQLPFRRLALRDTIRSDTQARFFRPGAAFKHPRWSFDNTMVAYSSDQNLPGDRDVFVGQVTFDHAPTFTGLLSDYDVPAGTPFTLALQATDPDGETITFKDVPLYRPAGATFSGSTFQWNNPGPPDAAFFVVFRALDPSGGLANRVVRLHVLGGGGCPFVDSRTAEGWQVENSLLARSLSGAMALDAYRLRGAPEIVNGRVQLRLRENEQEYTTLDQVRLVAVDHAPEVQAFASGNAVLLGTRVSAHWVTTRGGKDVTGLLSGSPTSYFVGEPGETLTVQMYASGRTGALGAERTENGGPGEIDPGDKGGGEGSRVRVATGDAVTQGAVADAAILGSSGIRIQGPDGSGGWRTIETRYPRENFDEQVLDSLSGDMRLIFIGRHRLRFVGHIEVADRPAPQLLSLLSAKHSRLGDQLTPMSTTGATTTALTPGDTLTLEFAAPPVPQGKVRDWIVLLSGVYSSALPATQQAADLERLPTLISLAQNQPNPFVNITTVGFELPQPARVRLDMFDLQGRLVGRLADRSYDAGRWSIEWDRRGTSGLRVPPGVYLYRMQAGAFTVQRKMVVLP